MHLKCIFLLSNIDSVYSHGFKTCTSSKKSKIVLSKSLFRAKHWIYKDLMIVYVRLLGQKEVVNSQK